MARLNIEDCWWTDPRRSALARKIGSEDKADIAAIRAWKLAQEFWKKGKGLVPIYLFEVLEYYQELLDCHLAEVRGEFVYVRGSSAYLDWVREAREKAQKAGKASAEARKKKHGTSQPLNNEGKNPKSKEPDRTTTEQEPNKNRTKSNLTEPSVSGSVSISISDNTPHSPPKGEQDGLQGADPPTSPSPPPPPDPSPPEEEKNHGFEETLGLYLKTFPGTVQGPNALARFKTQIQNSKKLQELREAIGNYEQFLAATRANGFDRRPKQSFATFLGTPRSGAFWRDYIAPILVPDTGPPPKQSKSQQVTNHLKILWNKVEEEEQNEIQV